MHACIHYMPSELQLPTSQLKKYKPSVYVIASGQKSFAKFRSKRIYNSDTHF